METRTRRKPKVIKEPTPENIIENSINQPIQPEIEDEGQNHQNKKLKTENNSKNHNLFLLPVKDPKSFKASLDLLKIVAADNEAFENNQENVDTLSAIIDYKYRSRKAVFTKDLFERKLRGNVTPAIFAKKSQVRSTKPKTPMDLAFENYLHLVAQLYYKANFQPSNVVAVFEANGLFSDTDDSKAFLPLKKPGKRGRKAKVKPNAENTQENADPSNIVELENTSLPENEPREDIPKDDVQAQVETIASSKIDIMDSLVSPLKVDYVFEKWSPKEVAIFEAGICKYGKEFSFIQFLIKTKTINETIQFYFAWKNTSHYRIWKYHKNIENKANYNSWL